MTRIEDMVSEIDYIHYKMEEIVNEIEDIHNEIEDSKIDIL
jgi:uncharacterized coiled-coil DUF342 family protein